jgi:hypothetical protein
VNDAYLLLLQPQHLDESQDDPFGVSDDFETPYHLLDDDAK